MMPSATAGNPYENDPVIEQDLIDPDGKSCPLSKIQGEITDSELR